MDVVRLLQGVGAEFWLQQTAPLQEEHGNVEGADIGVRRGSTGHQLPQQHAKGPLRGNKSHLHGYSTITHTSPLLCHSYSDLPCYSHISLVTCTSPQLLTCYLHYSQSSQCHMSPQLLTCPYNYACLHSYSHIPAVTHLSPVTHTSPHILTSLHC